GIIIRSSQIILDHVPFSGHSCSQELWRCHTQSKSSRSPDIWLSHVFDAGLTLENFMPLTLIVQRSDGFLAEWCFSWNTGHKSWSPRSQQNGKRPVQNVSKNVCLAIPPRYFLQPSIERNLLLAFLTFGGCLSCTFLHAAFPDHYPVSPACGEDWNSE
ncbi:mCG145964, partial [Mus musculus]